MTQTAVVPEAFLEGDRVALAGGPSQTGWSQEDKQASLNCSPSITEELSA